ncbi:alpha/beta hydrolase [Vibrio ezurae]|uniref:Putative hydrolase n=1 Tax=Vibrio ezurae NBRC 102218 TaxID=1219080 RepID=U3CJL2_9VIBR|nr:alpha/beta hydrolase [Vibrio ezurae]GAD81309.1 putative hydrolase [Vibrio ezurae NBRC 102218]
MFEEQTFQVREYVLSALSYEPENATKCLLFVHGWLDNAASFTPLLKEIQAHNPNLKLVALDLPGHGLSSHARDGFYPFHDYIDVLHQVVMQLKEELKSHSSCPLVLIGHSLGALVASCYSAAFPEHIDHLVQIEGYGPISEPENNALQRLRKGVISRQWLMQKPQRYFNSIDEMRDLRAARYGLTPAQIAPLVERDSLHCEKGWQWRHDNKLKAQSLYRMSQRHAQQVIEALPNSNLLILGESGFKDLDVHCASHTQIVQVKGGHHCHYTSPHQVAVSIFELILPK